MLRRVLLGLALLVSPAAFAEPLGYFMPEGVALDPAIPVPQSVIGHELGEKPVRHDRMVRYLRAVAAASDRISIETIGYSHEGRPIEFLVVTSPQNHADLEAIRDRHVALTDPSSGQEPGADMPVVTWLNYGVHGAEASGMDAVVPTAYFLAAAQGDAIEETLSDSVVLLTAVFNPDGHSRRINHVYTFLSEVPNRDPAHAAHDLWLTARTNHYWFDLNRQWLLLTQPESKAWIEKWHHWKPNLSVDYHEMGSNATYYFHPGVPSRRNPLIPARAREILSKVAGYHAGFLDAEARLYYTEESFDNYYIGKGSTYPGINGSVGILFEAGAARGGEIETINGVRTYADNIRTHFRTSLTSIDGAAGEKADLLAHQRRFFKEALELANASATKAYVFASPDKARLNHFLELLAHHRVEAYALGRMVEADGRRFAAGEAYIVPMAQAQYRMIRGLFDRVRAFKEEVFYDVSGWTMPLAYDLDYAALEAGSYASALLGGPAEAAFPPAPAPEEADYGYVFDWIDYYAPRALYRLLGEEVIARIATEPFTVRTEGGEQAFGRGAVFVPLARQEADAARIHAIVSDIAEEDGIPVHAVISGRTPTPGVDLGGRTSFTTVEAPSVLLLFGDGIISYDAGEVWHLLDHRMHMPVTLREASKLEELDWSRYTHLVLPGGRGARLDEAATERVAQWVREEGGTVIALRQGAAWAEAHLLGADEEKKDDARDDAEEDEEAPERADYADFQIREAKDVIGGAIFAGDLDITHPLGFGYADRRIASHRNTEIVLKTPDNPYATVVRYPEETPILSGYASDKRLEEIAGSPMLVAERLGRGSVILFADNPLFRGTFYGTNKLFMNSIFFSTSFARPLERAAEGH